MKPEAKVKLEAIKDCTTCKSFESFQDAYFDELEPEDEGFCINVKSPRYGNEGAGAGYVCDSYSRKENTK